MKRRGFCSLVFGALCAPFLPKPTMTGLMFHKDAFSMAMEPLGIIQTFVPEHWSSELFVTSGGHGYIYRSEDVACSVEDFRRLCQPHFEAAQRQLAEAIDRG